MSEEERELTKESVLIGWKAPEFQSYERSWVYYSIFAVILLAVIAYAVYTKDWFVLVIFVILAVFIIWYQRKEPKIKTYRITQLGIYEDNKFYQYSEIYSYWLLARGEHKALNIIFAKKYLPQMTILLDKIDPIKIREVLSKYIPEEGNRTETLLDRLVRFFRL